MRKQKQTTKKMNRPTKKKWVGVRGSGFGVRDAQGGPSHEISNHTSDARSFIGATVAHAKAALLFAACAKVGHFAARGSWSALQLRKGLPAADPNESDWECEALPLSQE